MKKVTYGQVLATLRKSGRWRGYIAPSNVALNHIVRGWAIGYLVEASTVEEFLKVRQSYMIYNCNSELGKHLQYWEERT